MGNFSHLDDPFCGSPVDSPNKGKVMQSCFHIFSYWPERAVKGQLSCWGLGHLDAHVKNVIVVTEVINLPVFNCNVIVAIHNVLIVVRIVEGRDDAAATIVWTATCWKQFNSFKMKSDKMHSRMHISVTKWCIVGWCDFGFVQPVYCSQISYSIKIHSYFIYIIPKCKKIHIPRHVYCLCSVKL